MHHKGQRQKAGHKAQNGRFLVPLGKAADAGAQDHARHEGEDQAAGDGDGRTSFGDADAQSCRIPAHERDEKSAGHQEADNINKACHRRKAGGEHLGS